MILLDTSPLVALCDARDGKHRTAVGHLESLAAEDFAICEAVVTEACFHLPHLHQRQRLRALLELLGVHALPLTYERAFLLEVLEWLAKYGHHDPDWADGCLAVLCGRDKHLKIWTYDREFRTTWRRPNGTGLPLAIT
ncbi:MAG TPA: PIN domain-containing protein [Vicinamibacterales bacterium]|nr:PIN domain-containing protein [Vicinamibacterales bacterium]